LPADGTIQRYAKHRHPKRYMQATQNAGWLAEKRLLTQDERVFEFFLNQLRLKQGVHIDDFGPRTGLQWKFVETPVQKAIDTGLLEIVEKRLRPTILGWRFVNEVQQMFLP
jgi:oxygen-independent coproporphyrinogen-3 oxidase